MNNPVSTNWYADPESRVYGDTVYMYVTKSLPFEEQLNLDLVTTKDLENFEIYKDILDYSADTYHEEFRDIIASQNKEDIVPFCQKYGYIRKQLLFPYSGKDSGNIICLYSQRRKAVF